MNVHLIIKHERCIMRTRDLDKQQRIKNAMIALILKEGINGASVAKIAKVAGVSPATIYVYYENKEEMLSEVFGEYVRKSYTYITDNVVNQMSGEQFIETLIRRTYAFALENQEIFSFVEQCSACPTLQESVSHDDYCKGVFSLIHDYQNRGVIKKYSDPNLAAVLFAPVKFMARNRSSHIDAEAQLNELIAMMQDLLLY